MLIFDHNQFFMPDELARLTDSSLPFFRRMIAGGCPTSDGKLSYSAFVSWVAKHYAEVLRDFRVETFPANGHYSEQSQFWLLRPVVEWALNENDSWLDIGGPGVDGISWALRRGARGVFAYYPIDAEFAWKADDAQSLVSGWEAGSIWV
jgi:hypothetical protein